MRRNKMKTFIATLFILTLAACSANEGNCKFGPISPMGNPTVICDDKVDLTVDIPTIPTVLGR